VVGAVVEVHVAAPVPQAVQAPALMKYPVAQVNGIGPVVHVGALVGHG